MRKIIVACNSGLGTSLMIRINLEALLKELGVSAEVEHTDVTSMYAHGADLIIGSSVIIDGLDPGHGVEAIGLEDILDRQYLKRKLLDSPAFRQWLPAERREDAT
ncbi:hypothetical protein ABD76_06515 [Paenibacillus dendritiformis]|uniref:PTS sugar transporter subunit IIB n=1 Tax=Paenibacillus dendritiformis TaxID=130049 RepID=UPI0018CCBC29|nr:PTS sugar transporter subunit IIB [Paenibacillus dendritiformis]MBG9792166.1 hypothetical protein [Paenibacillus dendritiformis]